MLTAETAECTKEPKFDRQSVRRGGKRGEVQRVAHHDCGGQQRINTEREREEFRARTVRVIVWFEPGSREFQFASCRPCATGRNS